MKASPSTEKLLEALVESLQPLGKLIVAFSGGVDSSVVVAAAVRALGQENVLAVTAKSETLPDRELEEAVALSQFLGVPHAVIETRELDSENFCANAFDRCYHCKTELWQKIGALAEKNGIGNMADGVNAEDGRDVRPGIKASDEAMVLHPLSSIGADKNAVRDLAEELGLPNWDKPAQACLSSRFPYGKRITVEGLGRVEKAEELLRDLGVNELRVRDHGDIARIEIPVAEIENILNEDVRSKLVFGLKKLGFIYVTLDLEGFRSGSMNEILR